MIRTLLIGASLGFALAIAFTAAWQPQRSALAEPNAQERARQVNAQSHRAVGSDDVLGTAHDDARRGREFSPDLVERVIEVARRLDPQMAAELRALCDDHPERLEHALRTTARRYVALADLKVRDPDLYSSKMDELETEAHLERLARQIIEAKGAGDESRAAVLREELQTAAQLHIALTIKSRGDSIRRLEEHVQALREELDRYASNFEANWRTRMAQAIEQAEREADAAVARSR